MTANSDWVALGPQTIFWIFDKDPLYPILSREQSSDLDGPCWVQHSLVNGGLGCLTLDLQIRSFGMSGDMLPNRSWGRTVRENVSFLPTIEGARIFLEVHDYEGIVLTDLHIQPCLLFDGREIPLLKRPILPVGILPTRVSTKRTGSKTRIGLAGVNLEGADTSASGPEHHLQTLGSLCRQILFDPQLQPGHLDLPVKLPMHHQGPQNIT